MFIYVWWDKLYTAVTNGMIEIRMLSPSELPGSLECSQLPLAPCLLCDPLELHLTDLFREWQSLLQTKLNRCDVVVPAVFLTCSHPLNTDTALWWCHHSSPLCGVAAQTLLNNVSKLLWGSFAPPLTLLAPEKERNI